MRAFYYFPNNWGVCRLGEMRYNFEKGTVFISPPLAHGVGEAKSSHGAKIKNLEPFSILHLSNFMLYGATFYELNSAIHEFIHNSGNSICLSLDSENTK